jgi:hypothetical protein
VLSSLHFAGIQILTRKLVSVQLEIPDVTKSISIYKRGFMEDFFNPGTKFVDSNAEAFFQGYHIYHCNSEKQSTAAFDFCHVFKDKTRQRTKILLHGETRYSVPNDTKELTTLLSFPDDILNKRKKLEKEYINGTLISIIKYFATDRDSI